MARTPFPVIVLCVGLLPGLYADAQPPPTAVVSQLSGRGYQALCWHDIPLKVDGDAYAVSLGSFIRQIDYLGAEGYAFVSVDEILEASRGGRSLPEKAVLLTFDDAYESFYSNVFPLLKAKGYPCVLAVVSSWHDYPEGSSEHVSRLMSWAQIKEVADSGLVEIASHSHDGHRAIAADPYGSTAPALAVRAYDISARAYESAQSYEARVLGDLRSSAKVLEERVERKPRVLVWPYGRYTAIGVSVAQKAGFSMNLTLDSGRADVADLREVPRQMIAGDLSADSFASGFSRGFLETTALRIVQADLDLVYDPDPRIRVRNLNAFVERIARLKPSVVYLQAFANPEGDGVVKSVYFPNRVLPMKADFFGRACRALSLHGIQVYAWMPMLCVRLPDEAENERLQVRERRGGTIAASSSWYSNRLSPFSEEAVRKLEILYEDLASVAMLDGVLFQDDGYLNDFEDFSVHGIGSYEKIAGSRSAPFERLSSEQKRAWTELKTDKLIELTERLKAKVRQWRPAAAFARCLYASTVLDAASEEWYAQNFPKSLGSYDYVVIMAYPDMELAADADSWLRSIVEKAAAYPGGLERSVFKTQSYDWAARKWVDSSVLLSRLRVLASAGAQHLGYYPDDYTVGRPVLAVDLQSPFPFDPPTPEARR